MNLPKKITITRGRANDRRTERFELIEEHEKFGLYRNLKTGIKECFLRRDIFRLRSPEPKEVCSCK